MPLACVWLVVCRLTFEMYRRTWWLELGFWVSFRGWFLAGVFGFLFGLFFFGLGLLRPFFCFQWSISPCTVALFRSLARHSCVPRSLPAEEKKLGCSCPTCTGRIHRRSEVYSLVSCKPHNSRWLYAVWLRVWVLVENLVLCVQEQWQQFDCLWSIVWHWLAASGSTCSNDKMMRVAVWRLRYLFEPRSDVWTGWWQ